MSISTNRAMFGYDIGIVTALVIARTIKNPTDGLKKVMTIGTVAMLAVSFFDNPPLFVFFGLTVFFQLGLKYVEELKAEIEKLQKTVAIVERELLILRSRETQRASESREIHGFLNFTIRDQELRRRDREGDEQNYSDSSHSSDGEDSLSLSEGEENLLLLDPEQRILPRNENSTNDFIER